MWRNGASCSTSQSHPCVFWLDKTTLGHKGRATLQNNLRPQARMAAWCDVLNQVYVSEMGPLLHIKGMRPHPKYRIPFLYDTKWSKNRYWQPNLLFRIMLLKNLTNLLAQKLSLLSRTIRKIVCAPFVPQLFFLHFDWLKQKMKYIQTSLRRHLLDFIGYKAQPTEAARPTPAFFIGWLVSQGLAWAFN